MRDGARLAVIIPALNEERAIGRVLDEIPAWVDQVLVVDNGCTDRTAEVARAHGATVLHQPERGYGAACLLAIEALHRIDIVVFLDGDYSDFPGQMPALVDPILAGEAELVIGSRTLGRRERGALTPQARFGNWLSCWLVSRLWGVPPCTDLGPFRAITLPALQRLQMVDRNYGWTVEMQAKAAARGMAVKEVPVDYRVRIGQSKVSGTVSGVFKAGAKILYTIFKLRLEERGGAGPPC